VNAIDKAKHKRVRKTRRNSRANTIKSIVSIGEDATTVVGH